ncbi:MAG: tryptophan--tRNA ligase [Candidatus Oxydemutatoraceae bacterium WSBS_2016_MAG_OTU14]
MNKSHNNRVVSGMRPTGAIHLGHYHGVLKNWLDLQDSNECYFFVADLHALTTHHDQSQEIEDKVFDMVVDWLAVGINPGAATLFVQSKIAEHSELHLLLSMITPVTWLERVPSYKDMQSKTTDSEQATYGFLGYPLLQAADILIYKAGLVPVGEDQVAHIELAREIARRFNHLFGRRPNFMEKIDEALGKLSKKDAELYEKHRRNFQEKGSAEAFEAAQALVYSQTNIAMGDAERLLGHLEGGGKIILTEPQALLTPTPKVPGIDGEKMSKSYRNTISLREDDDSIKKKILAMMTDPARVKRSDPGDPNKCPVWDLHQLYSNEEVKNWAGNGCRSAEIGCVDCKRPLIDAVCKEIGPIRERALEYQCNKQAIRKIIVEGNDKARAIAHDTLNEVRQEMNLMYA